ncbi:MAG: sodium:solute symporter [Proteobacteria bacterium]|nr:sodium:solute symporter [Pseudomonadota bacterium]
MLLTFVVAYLCVSIFIGLYAARRVRTSSDYIVAGRSLPIYVTIATVFATWFGSETVLGIPATFLDGGMGSIIADPFGASLCLILVGLVFARPLYRMKLLTIGDFYRKKFGRGVEMVVSFCIAASYLGWVAAQVIALGLVLDLLSGNSLGMPIAMTIGTGIVLLYTLFGGMWSVAMTDFMQMVVIMIGLAIIAFFIGSKAGGPMAVIDHAAAADKFTFLPERNWTAWFAFISAWLTMGFGSIPQQDVFQRVMSAKDENAAVQGTVIGGVLYMLFAFIPVFLAYSALLIDPNEVNILMTQDSQRILPALIMDHTPVAVQILFFGALLSAIMSTASGALLAPATVFAENVVRPLLPKLDDRHMLRLTRGCVLVFSFIVLYLAQNSEIGIFEMVENASKVTLAGAFVPLFAGIYWKRANKTGAVLSILFGISVWLGCEYTIPEDTALMPAQMAGFIAAIIGMLIGGYWRK